MVLLTIENLNVGKCKHESVIFSICIIFKQLTFLKFCLITFVCLILAKNYNSSRTVSIKLLTLPVAAQPTLIAIKHLWHVTDSERKWTCRLEVATQSDCLEERFCFASTWFLYRLFNASKLMSSLTTIVSKSRWSFLKLTPYGLCPSSEKHAMKAASVATHGEAWCSYKLLL